MIALSVRLKFNLALAVVRIKPCKTMQTVCAGKMSLKYIQAETITRACARASIIQSVQDYKSALELTSGWRLIAGAVPSQSQE